MDSFALDVLLWIVVIVQALAIAVLVRQLAELEALARVHKHLKSQPLRPGTVAPDFQAKDLQSGEVIDSARWRGRSIVLLFVSPACNVCRRVLAELAAASPAGLADLVVYCDDEEGKCAGYLAALAHKTTLLTRESATDVSYLYRVTAFPVAVSIDKRWIVTDVRHPTTVADMMAASDRHTDPVEQLDAA
jgi:hypothetical protein